MADRPRSGLAVGLSSKIDTFWMWARFYNVGNPVVLRVVVPQQNMRDSFEHWLADQMTGWGRDGVPSKFKPLPDPATLETLGNIALSSDSANRSFPLRAASTATGTVPLRWSRRFSGSAGRFLIWLLGAPVSRLDECTVVLILSSVQLLVLGVIGE